MRKIFTFLLSVLLVSTLSAQKPWVELPKADEVPVIGGEIDAAWDVAEQNDILLPFQAETPTLGQDGETWWKGLWTTEGIYILVNVTDDDYYPYYASEGTLGYMYDQIELYFDCNFVKVDGVGSRPEGLQGHYQVAPGVPEGDDNGTMLMDYQSGSGIKYSYNATDAPNYFVEYFIPLSHLKDQEGVVVDIESEIGFDVTVIDGDRSVGEDNRQRQVWANNGDIDESWNNMDDAGLITLEGATVYYVEEIILTGGESSGNDPFQVGVELVSDDPPNPPTDKSLKWTISDASTARAKISATGLITPLTNGTVIVSAMSSDGYVESDEVTVTFTDVRTGIQTVSYIVDGFNDNPNEDGTPNDAWARGDGFNGHTAMIEDGVFHFSSDSVLAQPWSMKVRQAVDLPLELKEEKWTASWVMWAAEETTFELVLEDRGNGWAHMGVATGYNTENAIPDGGNSRWDLTVTTEPQRFVVNFIPNLLNEQSNEDFCFQNGLTGVDIYMDSLFLIPSADSAIVDWEYTSVERNIITETLNVYPNPASDVLNISLSGVGTKTRVAIYNSVGLKMEEIEVVGNHHSIDVSNYSSGLYFVKANDRVVKFVR